MESYVESSLLGGERVIYTGKVSLWALSGYWMGALIALLLAIASPVFLLLVGVLLLAGVVLYLTTELAITDRRVIAKFGLIQRKTVEMYLSKVESLNIDQSILGRVLGYGTIKLTGAGGSVTPIPNISRPMQFRRCFMETADAHH